MKSVTLLVLLLTVFLSAFVPAGWMPKTLADGHMILVICTGDDFAEMMVDQTGAPVPLHEQTGEERSPCAFSAVAEIPQILTGPFPLPRATSLRARWQHRDFTHNSAGFHRRYDARGPPLLS